MNTDHHCTPPLGAVRTGKSKLFLKKYLKMPPVPSKVWHYSKRDLDGVSYKMQIVQCGLNTGGTSFTKSFKTETSLGSPTFYCMGG